MVLLRPSSDTAVSLEVLRQRCAVDKGTTWHVDDVDWLAMWLTDGRDEVVATHVVLTGDDTPPETASGLAALGGR